MPSNRISQASRSEAGRLEIARQIDLLADALARVPGVVSVILMGSAARNEQAWTEVEGRPQLFSDLEFLAVTDDRLPVAQRGAAEAALSRIAAGFGQRSPLFHVDILFRERRRLSTMPPIVFTFELARLGRELRGSHEKARLPQIDAGNLDLGNTREILMKRLWATAERVPEALLRGVELDSIAARSLGVALWRNPLDVPTVLLPSVGILEAGYEARQRIWTRHPELPFREFLDERFGSDTGVYLRDCLALRRDCAAPVKVEAAHRDAITLIIGGLDWLSRFGDGANARDVRNMEIDSVVDSLRAGPSGSNADQMQEGRRTDPATPRNFQSPALDDSWLEDVADRIATSGQGLFNKRPIARGEWLALGTQTVRFSYSAGIRAALRWWKGARKAQLCAALIHLHRALPPVMGGDLRSARPALDKAMRTCAAIVPLEATLVSAYRDALAAGDSTMAWLVVRAQVARVFWRVVRLGSPAAWRAIATSIDLPAEWR